MASIDIAKLVQESVAVPGGTNQETFEGVDLDGLNAKMKEVAEASGEYNYSKATYRAGKRRGEAEGVAKGIKKGVKKGATAAGIGGVAAATATGLGVKKAMDNKMATHQKHAEVLRQAAKDKLANLQDKAQGMGSQLKTMGTQALDKIKDNPKAAAGIAAGTAGAVGAGLAAKKLMAMRKAKKSAAA